MENRDTGELLRDDGDWTVVLFYGPSGNRVVRLTTSGAVWRLTVPGEGIIVHQSGRLIRIGDERTYSRPRSEDVRTRRRSARSSERRVSAPTLGRITDGG